MKSMRCEKIAASANCIARWCALRSTERLAPNMADLFVLFGGGVIGSVDVLADAMRQGVARKYAIVGGRGHATYWLDYAMQSELARWGTDVTEASLPGIASEAEMMQAVLWHRHGLRVDFLETKSTNCGNNITYLMDLLEASGEVPARMVLAQDATMQRRMDVTWKRQAHDRKAFSHTQVIDWALWEVSLVARDNTLQYEHAPEGMWPIDVYLGLLAGEVDRLTDNERGYGPRGRDFVVHVDVPDEVRQAHALLEAYMGSNVRPPDERYA